MAVFAPPKTERSRRTIELSDATVSALRQYRSEQSTRRLMLGPAWREQGLVFPRRSGHPGYPGCSTEVTARC